MDPQKFKPGESILCKIHAPQPGGYHVKLLPSELDGFLPSQENIEIGRVVPGTFVCMNEDRALMAYAFMIGTTERVQLSTLSDPENAFAVWADSYPRAIKLRRAVDLIMPPFGGQSAKNVRAGDANISSLLKGLEQGQFTGCLKTMSQQNLSRAAALLLKGRAVGCVYTKKPIVDPFPMETALRLMLEDLNEPQTEIQMYDLQDDIILSMSSMFLGCTIKQPDGTTNNAFVEKSIRDMTDKKQTACLSLFDGSSMTARCLGFVHKGEFLGTYRIDDQTFSIDTAAMYSFVGKDETRAEVYFLPPEMISGPVTYGYSFSSEVFAGIVRK